ncbi:Glutamate [NMDA] receptor subunit 1 like [Actinidia chinensis var. chinensis]|uniref:Glutamate [NMDA] receptor subunit 1 like n=1 Tax=Actinidia chinensis var. chinensis TaxID=1590841 RepID=A0A2R6RT97_ACTCC|nr:Glutamate [NMDA] receptor subunit 1 like [Actinidia chinensis var. chinensis]
MEAYCYYQTKTNVICSSSLSKPKTKYSSIPLQPIHTQQLCIPLSNPRRQNRRALIAVDCGRGGSDPVVELERELEEEMRVSGEEWFGIEGRWREKCEGRERVGIVELLECLEREAIMGEDEGREPNDYNRRAQIFDKSSRVFQALKERNTPHET